VAAAPLVTRLLVQVKQGRGPEDCREVANGPGDDYSLPHWAASISVVGRGKHQTINRQGDIRHGLPSLGKERHGNDEHAPLGPGVRSASWTEAIEASGFPSAETAGRPGRGNGERAARHYCFSARIETSGSGQREGVAGARSLVICGPVSSKL
jgi:hypothetical protein